MVTSRRRRGERPIMYGRDRERAQLRQLLDDAIAGHGSLVLVSGEAGIGKTTLVADLTAAAQGRGYLVLTGGCYDLTTTPPYGPWIEVIRSYPADGNLPTIPEQLQEGTDLEGIHSQTALFELASRFFQAVAAARPLVLLLEDVQWADRGSLDLLRHLGRSLSGHRILVLTTYRDDELTRRDPLFQLIPPLVRESDATRLDLQGWTGDDLRSFVAAHYTLSDADRDRLAAYLEERAEGHPLFVVELLHTLEAEAVLEPTADGWKMSDLTGVPVPTFVVQLIEGRLRALDDGVRRLLAIAAIVGQDVPLDLWQTVSGASDSELGATLTRAIGAGILEEIPGEESVRFPHALIREALYGEVDILQRRGWHRAAADALLATPRPDPDAVITHLRPAGDPRLIDWLIRSGDRAASRFAWDAAVERYMQASEIIEVQGHRDPVEICQVLLKLGQAQNNAGASRHGGARGAGDAPEAQATFWKVATIAREAGLPEQLGEAAHGIAGVNITAHHGGPDGFRLMVEALEALPDEDSSHRTRLLARLATGALVLSSLQEMTDIATVEQVDAWSTEAIAMARRLGDPRTLAYALLCRNFVTFGLYAFDERRVMWDEIIALATRTNDLPLVAWALNYRSVDPIVAGDFDTAREFTAQFTALAERLHMPVLDWLAATDHAGALLSAGRYAEAGSALEQAEATWSGGAAAAAQTVAVHRELADLQAMKGALLPNTSGILSFPLRLQYLLEADEFDTARDELQPFIDGGYLLQALPKRSVVWLRLAAVAAEGCAALGDAGRARLIYEQLAAFDGLNIYAGYAQYSMGSVSHYLGLLARTMGGWDAAERHFAQALEQNDRWDLQPAAAYTRYEWAAMLHQRGKRGDRERAGDLLGQAQATARASGMVRLSRLTTALSRDLGTSDQTHPDGLTPREVEVLRLIAAGHSNREMAEDLYLSQRTIERHIANIYLKIDAHNRTEAARYAFQHHLGDMPTM